MTTYEGFYHYPPVDDLAMRWGVYVTGAGRGIIRPGQPYPPQGHPLLYEFHWHRGRTLPEFQVILITDGRGEFESRDTGLRRLGPSSLVVLFPGVWHRYRPDPQSGWTERWIGFHGEMTHRLLNLGVIAPADPLHEVQNAARMADTFDRLLDHVHAEPLQNTIPLSMRALSLLADVIQQTTASAAPPSEPSRPGTVPVHDRLVVQAMELIWTHSHRQISVETIARELPVTRRTLDRRFQAATGRTVLEEITRCRLSRARRLLAETELPVKTVAYLAGFPTAERMRVAFLRMSRASPSQFRAAALKRGKLR